MLSSLLHEGQPLRLLSSLPLGLLWLFLSACSACLSACLSASFGFHLGLLATLQPASRPALKPTSRLPLGLLSSLPFGLLSKVHNVPKFILMGHMAAFVNYLGVQQEVFTFVHSFIGGIPLWLPFAWANACALARYL